MRALRPLSGHAMKRMYVITVATFVFCIQALGMEKEQSVPNFTGYSFESLDEKEIELLRELAAKLATVASDYRSLSIEVHQHIYRIEPDSSETLEVHRKLQVVRDGADYYRVEGTGEYADGLIRSGLFLVNKDDGWSLQLDRKSHQYFMVSHGKSLTAPHHRYDEWWCNAPYSAHIHSVADDLLVGNAKSHIDSVRAMTDSDGNEVVKITRTLQPSAAWVKGLGLTINDVYVFYRTHDWALKEVIRYDWQSGTINQLKTTQTCRYNPFGKETPKITHVVLERSKRPRDSTGDWTPYLREEIDVTDLELATPSRTEFDINRFLDTSKLIQSPGASSVKWYFAGAGLFFLGIWNYLRRREGRSRRISAESPPTGDV